MVAWWPPANTTFGPTWIFLHLQTWTDTSSPSLTNQRMIIIHHCLAPSRLGMTKHPKLSLSHSCPLPPPLATVTAAHTVLGTLGTRAVWLAHGQQPRGTDKPGCTSPFPHCSEPVPNPDAVLLPATLGQCQQQSLQSPVHLIYTQDRHFLSWSHPCSSSHHFQFLD